MKLHDTYFEEYINITPSLNDYLNLSKYKYLKNKMENPYSLDYKFKNIELFNKYISKLNKIKRTTIYDKVLKHICTDNLNYFSYNFMLTPINHHENIIYELFECANGNSIYIYSNKSDYNKFIEKISIFSEIVNSIIINMEHGIKQKYTLPKIMTYKLITQLKDLIKNKSYINNNIKFKLDFNFNKKCEEIFIPPTNKLIDFLENKYLEQCRTTIGLCHQPNGYKEYNFLVKHSTTLSNIKIDDIHNYGIKEVERIYSEMNKIKDKMKFKGNLKEFNKFLRKRKDINFKSSEEVLQCYKDEVKTINKTIMKTQFHDQIKGRCKILPVPKYNEKYSPEAYYIPGDIEQKRKGKFYINLRNIKNNSKMEVESLTIHETLPGHHYQITYVNENDNIPLFLKAYNNDAYQEGWALYCENLGKYKTYESYFGKLILELLRAIRLVVDTGIHHYGWNYNKTFKYIKKYSFDSDENIKSQIDRYIVLPSQALSYKIGEKIILELKSKFKKNGGNSKDFHKKILDHGPLPLEILKEIVFK
jgi:uncharacterized protein (DUF885 family)